MQSLLIQPGELSVQPPPSIPPVLSGSHPRQARFGPAKQPMAASIRRLLASGAMMPSLGCMGLNRDDGSSNPHPGPALLPCTLPPRPQLGCCAEIRDKPRPHPPPSPQATPAWWAWWPRLPPSSTRPWRASPPPSFARCWTWWWSPTWRPARGWSPRWRTRPPCQTCWPSRTPRSTGTWVKTCSFCCCH